MGVKLIHRKLTAGYQISCTSQENMTINLHFFTGYGSGIFGANEPLYCNFGGEIREQDGRSLDYLIFYRLPMR
ncbi:hypothetical protein [Cylindrospermopsis raciborskii]|uniref:Uncharacterized protein n=1 Tax=Cylindrospermopsis raciborskii CENA302 TaxID=1170768 RepID=A0A9Q5QWM1_9CYAN|nr:hypothetical protein [Cylindrospermopsis raciborskii]NLQ05600.1 hypothetical protein [Cylindrospermopsis raciborskii MVCC19]OHY36436.1 hypothetical protein BCV64_01310 [Cylindrospermopsis raciborskii MVCC14]OPH09710.1 hypothetical protein CENA302_07910 [Cylindrospermopsis raciborskii CENA302]